MPFNSRYPENDPCAIEPTPDYATTLSLSEDNFDPDDSFIEDNLWEDDDGYSSNMLCDTYGMIACTISCKRFCECHPPPKAEDVA